MARDIAEFEKNKHLARPCTTLDGFNVNMFHYNNNQVVKLFEFSRCSVK